MHEVLVNRLGGLGLPRKSVVRLTDRPDMTLDVYRGRKTTIQQHKKRHLDETMLSLVQETASKSFFTSKWPFKIIKQVRILRKWLNSCGRCVSSVDHTRSVGT